MSLYLPEGTCRASHARRLHEALDGVPFLTERDLVVLMGVDPRLCDERDFALARIDLHVMGYRERALSLWGRRASFLRWEKVAYAPGKLPWPCSRSPGRPIQPRGQCAS